MPGLTVSAHAWCDLLRREICCLQHGETESNVWNTFVWSCPTWPSRWGMHISIDWPRLKSCQAVCDECTRGEIYSSLSRDAGCLAMWSWRESCVTKIWGSGSWSRIRVISFRYHGFPYSTIGDFLDPYCNWNPYTWKYLIVVSLFMRLTTLHLVSSKITTVDDFTALALLRPFKL